MKNLNEVSLAELKGELGSLATASVHPIALVRTMEDGSKKYTESEATKYLAIVNDKTNEVASVLSDHYKLIQHRDAFEAVIDALIAVKPEAKVRASLNEHKSSAWLTVVYKDVVVDDGAEGIEIGFNIVNSFDGTKALRYGGSDRKFQQSRRLEFFGLRLACMNGLVVQFPAEDIMPVVPKELASVGDVIGFGSEEKVTEDILHSKSVSGYVRHIGKPQIQMDKLRAVIQSLPTVASRLEEQINTIKEIAVDNDQAITMLGNLGYSDRVIEKVMEQFEMEERTQWGVYNAVTSVATHQTRSINDMQNKVKKAQELLAPVLS